MPRKKIDDALKEVLDADNVKDFHSAVVKLTVSQRKFYATEIGKKLRELTRSVKR